MATKIGCDNLVFAKMTTEDTALAAPVYDTPVAFPGVMHVNINPNGSQETLFADDGPMDVASTLGKVDVEIQKNALTTTEKAFLLGHTIDANGGIVYSDNDVAPWVAMGFRSLKSNGHYRYLWLYKGRFTEPEDNSETKGDSINFQSDTVSGQFVKLINPITIQGKEHRSWKYELDEDSPTVSAAAISGWFSAVALPSNAAAKTLSSIAITTPPTKTTYAVGEHFSNAGMVVTATYSDSSTAIVTNYSAAPNGGLVTTDTVITVSYVYGGVTKTATQNITVE